MMSTTTVRVSGRTHATLRHLAAATGEPMAQLLERAVERMRVDDFFARLDDAYERVARDPAAAAEEAAERAAWEATLADDIDIHDA